MTRGHGLGVIILVRVALAQLPHSCGGVSIVIRAADIEQQQPELGLIFSHPLIADAVAQGCIVQACAGRNISWCDDGAWDFEPTNIVRECIQIKRYGVWADVSMNGHNRVVGSDDVFWALLKGK